MFLFFLGYWQLDVFSSDTMVFKCIRLIRRPAQKSKILYLFSFCSGNSNSCVRIKSHLITSFIQIMHFIADLADSHPWLRGSVPVSHQNSQPVKHLCDFVAVSIFNLPFFVREFSNTLIVVCAVSFHSSYVILCLASWTSWERNLCFQKSQREMFPSPR